jgi:hypothetical protein
VTTIPPEEMEKRHRCISRYRKAQRKAKIDEEIWSIRTAINILIEKEKELQAESEKLRPAKKARRARA